jgi:hypothetical protein
MKSRGLKGNKMIQNLGNTYLRLHNFTWLGELGVGGWKINRIMA